MDLVLEKELDTGLKEGELPLRRVTVEALDFDWLFERNNARILLSTLALDASDVALTKKSISIFISFMWSHYQPMIIKKILFPYCIYLAII